jgi:hypothetical protein
MHRWRIVPALAVFVLICAAGPALATPTYRVNCTPGSTFPGGAFSSSTTGVQCHGGDFVDYFAGAPPNNTQVLTYERDGVAEASGTTLRTSASAHVRARDLVNLGGPNSGQESRASMTIDDIVILAPAGYTDSTIVTSFDIILSGGVSASILHTNGIFFGGPEGTASAFLELQGPGFTATGLWTQTADANTGVTIQQSGLLSSGPGVITSPTFVAPIGTEFSITITFASGTYVEHVLIGSGACPLGCTQTILDADSSFMNTVSLPTTAEIFHLPAGFQVDSTSGLIVNNRAVPEPNAASLLISMAGIFGWMARKRHERSR